MLLRGASERSMSYTIFPVSLDAIVLNIHVDVWTIWHDEGLPYYGTLICQIMNQWIFCYALFLFLCASLSLAHIPFPHHTHRHDIHQQQRTALDPQKYNFIN